jgi:hypothetical protein
VTGFLFWPSTGRELENQWDFGGGGIPVHYQNTGRKHGGRAVGYQHLSKFTHVGSSSPALIMTTPGCSCSRVQPGRKHIVTVTEQLFCEGRLLLRSKLSCRYNSLRCHVQLTDIYVREKMCVESFGAVLLLAHKNIHSYCLLHKLFRFNVIECCCLRCCLWPHSHLCRMSSWHRTAIPSYRVL